VSKETKYAQAFESYLNARNWNDLVIAVHKSTLGLPADKLVEFRHEPGVSTLQRHIPNMERVTHRNAYDFLPRLLTRFSSLVSVCDFLHLDAEIIYSLYPLLRENPPLSWQMNIRRQENIVPTISAR
jgi:hypothetical protein